jgi:hypothetical protein
MSAGGEAGELKPQRGVRGRVQCAEPVLTPEITVPKLLIGVLLTVSILVSAPGCSREQPAPAASSPGTPPAGMPASQPHPVPAAPAGAVDLDGIEKADGGRTIAEIFAEKDQLAGQTVLFRGRVVKTNAGIMGRNWLHIRDGSGAEGTNDLTVTTVDVLPNVGDTVLVSGPLEVNKDFGMGYQYEAIIEDADVRVEIAGL